MIILVTGAAGFLGRSLIADLLNNGHKVRAVVRQLRVDFPVEVDQIVLGDLTKLGDVDLNSEDISNSVFCGIDSVIHTAARVHVLKDKAKNQLMEFRKMNRDATINLASMAASSGVKRFVFISSIGVNGINNIHPFTELDQPNPQGFYALSKYEAELGLFDIAKNTGMEVVIIRPPLVYGPSAKGNFGRLVKWIKKGIPLPLGAIKNKRSLIGLDNLVSFVIYCADFTKTPQAADQVFLISDGEDVSTTELLCKVYKSFGKRPWLIPLPTWLVVFAINLIGKGKMVNQLFGSLRVDNSKARLLLGWKPISTMDEQLNKTEECFIKDIL